jgi:acyl carrier protein
METTRPEVRGWDSLAYVSFIVGVEVEFGISKFRVAEVESFQNVGEIVRSIAAKVPAGQHRAG